jgi:membrane protease YdiL (CAAX protease family)
MPKPGSSRQQVIVFLLLTFVFSSIFYFLCLYSQQLRGAEGKYALGIKWCPGLAAMLILKLNGRKLSELGWRWPEARYVWMSWLVPLAYAAISYTIVWGCGLGGFPNYEFMQHLVPVMALNASPLISTVLYLLLTGTFGMITRVSSDLGEEIGWRGFLVPELFKNIGYTRTSLLGGAVWALWHYPLLIWSNYNSGSGEPLWFALICFTIMVMGDSFINTWLRLKSGSLWVAAIAHASHNLYIQSICTLLTRDTGKTLWFIDEFGVVVPIVTVFFAFYFWRRRHELEVCTRRVIVGRARIAE